MLGGLKDLIWIWKQHWAFKAFKYVVYIINIWYLVMQMYFTPKIRYLEKTNTNISFYYTFLQVDYIVHIHIQAHTLTVTFSKNVFECVFVKSFVTPPVLARTVEWESHRGSLSCSDSTFQHNKNPVQDAKNAWPHNVSIF